MLYDEYNLTTTYWVSQEKFSKRKNYISCGKWFKFVWFCTRFKKN